MQKSGKYLDLLRNFLNKIIRDHAGGMILIINRFNKRYSVRWQLSNLIHIKREEIQKLEAATEKPRNFKPRIGNDSCLGIILFNCHNKYIHGLTNTVHFHSIKQAFLLPRCLHVMNLVDS